MTSVAKPPTLLGWSFSPDVIFILIGQTKYIYQLPRYWIDKADAVWKHSPWRAFQLIKKQGKLLSKEKVF